MQPIHQAYHIDAPIEEVWQALVNPDYIEGWSGGPAKMNNQVGVEFSLWGGEIFGKNITVDNQAGGKKLVQQWQEKNWQEPSVVTFTLSEDNGVTKVELTHEQAPDQSYRSIDEGWRKRYLGPMKQYLEQKRG